MFCHKCGTQIAKGSAFCHICGTKVVHEDIEFRGSDMPQGPEPMVAPTLKSAETTTPPVEMSPQPEPRQGLVELVVTCAKLKGFFPGSVFPLLVDKVQIGELPNNGTFTSRIAPGPHQIKVGNVTIGINIPEREATVALKLQPSPSKTLEFVCSPGHIVTVPSSIERVTRQDMRRDLNASVIAGLVSFSLGVIGFIIGVMIPIGYPTLDYVIPVFVSALFLMASGSVFLILSPKTRKVKAKKAILGLVSVIAIGAVIVIVSSTVSFINWNRIIDEEFYAGDSLSGDTDTTSSTLAAADQLLFRGTPIQDIIGAHSSDIIAIFGEPETQSEYSIEYGVDEWEGFTEDGWMCFYLDNIGQVDEVSADPMNFTLNGQNLTQNFDTLVTILGDGYENLGGTAYMWQAVWPCGDYQLRISFPQGADTDIPFSVEILNSGAKISIDNDAYFEDDITYSNLDLSLAGRWRGYDGSALTLESNGYAATIFQFWNVLINKPDSVTWETSNGRLTLHAHSKEGYYWIIGEETYFGTETDRLYLNRITSSRTPYSTVPGEYYDVSYSRERTSTTDLAGAWDITYDRTLTLNSDGTGQLGSLPMTWEATETELYFYPVESRTYDYTVSGDTLTIFFNNGAKVYTRVGD